MTLLLLPMERTGDLRLAGIVLLVALAAFYLAFFRGAE